MVEKQVDSYECLAGFYNYLMRNIDYNSWAKYINRVASKSNSKIKSVLELGSGTMKLAERINRYYKNIIVSDLSYNMMDSSKKLQKRIVCDMRAIPFNSNFDLVFSAFDSVNYLLTPKDVIQFLKECHRILTIKGVLTFDAALENNSKNLLDFLSRKDENELYKFEQISLYDEKNQIHTNKFLISVDGELIVEEHKQKIYPFEDWFNFADKAGFYIENCYDCFSFNDGSPDSDRIQLVLKKKR